MVSFFAAVITTCSFPESESQVDWMGTCGNNGKCSSASSKGDHMLEEHAIDIISYYLNETHRNGNSSLEGSI